MLLVRQNRTDDHFYNRTLNADKSISPIRDTGFRYAGGIGHAYTARIIDAIPQRFFGDVVHNDDITVLGPAIVSGQELDRVLAVTVDRGKGEARERGYILTNIAVREKHERDQEKARRDGEHLSPGA